MLSLGFRSSDIYDKYREIIPEVMNEDNYSSQRTQLLKKFADDIFEDRKFDSLRTRIGIVTTNIDMNRPTIFKTHAALAYSGKASFVPGFGATISDALMASTAAVPYFDSYVVHSEVQGKMHLIDGGFVANNPSLFAITDACGALEIERKRIRLLSVGVGSYTQRPIKSGMFSKIGKRLLDNYFPTDIFEKTFEANSNGTENIVKFLFPDIKYFRVNSQYPVSEFSTNLLESDLGHLEKMYQHGRRSFGENEGAIIEVVN